MVDRTPPAGFPGLNRQTLDGTRIWQARAREFAQEVVRPVGQVLDRMESHDAVGPSSPIHGFLAQAHREGFTRLTDPVHLGGHGLTRGAEYAVLEELAAADAGLTAVLIAAPLPFRWARTRGTGRLAAAIAAPYVSGERTDWVGCFAAAPAGRIRATRDGAGWLLAGATSPWVPGAAVATHAVVACTVSAQRRDRHALAIVPLDRDGVSRRPAIDLLGLRAQARAQLFLDGVHLEDDELLLQAPGGPDPAITACALDHVATAVAAVGIARSAYDGSARLACEADRRGLRWRTTGSRPAAFRMFTLLEATRAITRAAHVHSHRQADAGEPCSLRQASAAHAFATAAASEIVDVAIELCARRADPRGVVEFLDGSTFRPEKLLRDAQSNKVARPAGIRPAPLVAAHR